MGVVGWRAVGSQEQRTAVRDKGWTALRGLIWDRRRQAGDQRQSSNKVQQDSGFGWDQRCF